MKLYICENIAKIKQEKKSPAEKISAIFAKDCICSFMEIDNLKTDIQFTYNAYGKPFIKSICVNGRVVIDNINNLDDYVNFSLSHSENMIICAVACFNIGADCQNKSISDATRCKKIAQRFYTGEENNFLDRLIDDTEYIDNFFNIWVKKEAYVKYTGKGLTEGLQTFSVANACEGQKNSYGNVNFEQLRTKESFHIAVCMSRTNINHLDIKYI